MNSVSHRRNDSRHFLLIQQSLAFVSHKFSNSESQRFNVDWLDRHRRKRIEREGKERIGRNIRDVLLMPDEFIPILRPYRVDFVKDNKHWPAKRFQPEKLRFGLFGKAGV